MCGVIDMGQPNAEPGCLIISGVPGAGKTTVSRLVAATFPRAARLDGDDMNELIITGRVGPVSEPADEAQRQLLLRARNLCSLANNFAEAGFVPIIDHVIPDREVLAFMVARILPRPIMFVMLAPPLEVCEQRNANRAVREQVFYYYSGLADEMARELGQVGWWFDTSAMTPEATAASIIANARREAAIEVDGADDVLGVDADLRCREHRPTLTARGDRDIRRAVATPPALRVRLGQVKRARHRDQHAGDHLSHHQQAEPPAAGRLERGARGQQDDELVGARAEHRSGADPGRGERYPDSQPSRPAEHEDDQSQQAGQRESCR